MRGLRRRDASSRGYRQSYLVIDYEPYRSAVILPLNHLAEPLHLRVGIGRVKHFVEEGQSTSRNREITVGPR
jgi:hypothetical protein